MSEIIKKSEPLFLTESKILRVNLDGNWTTKDFSNLFESLSLLNTIFIELEKKKFPSYEMYTNIYGGGIANNYINLDGTLYKKMDFGDTYENSNIFSDSSLLNLNFHNPSILEYNELSVKEIKYASPGFTDLIGLGKIIDSIFELIKFYFPNEKQNLQNKMTELDIIEKKFSIIAKYDLNEKDREKVLDIRNNTIRNLKHFELSDKIKGFEVKEYN